jgi:hypothetical protein
MLHAALDLSRARLDVCLVDDAGALVDTPRHRRTPTGCATSPSDCVVGASER